MHRDPTASPEADALAGRDLEQFDFHGSDLRGADLTGTRLHGADFRGARLGVGAGWQALLLSIALVSSLAIGIGAGLAGAWVHQRLGAETQLERAIGIAVLVLFTVFLVVAVWRGLRVAATFVLPAIAGAALVVGAIAVIVGAGTGQGALTVIVATALCAMVVALGSFARALAGIAGWVPFMVVAVSGALAGGIAGGGYVATLIAVAAMLTARRTLQRGTAAPILSKLVISLACARGTSFRDADLTGARFESTRVRCCDLRGARLEGARFDEREPQLCRVDGTEAA
jgi:hypothetical protein